MTGFLAFLAFVALLLFMRNISARVSRIEQKLKQGVPLASPQVQSTLRSAAMPPQAGGQTSNVPEQYASNQSVDSAFAEWLKRDWMLKLGALLLLMAFGWLTTYAFLHNWIGEAGRIMLGLIAGTLFIMIGWWRIRRFVHQGGVFLVLGSTTILFTVFAARHYYHYFDPVSALVIMFLSTAAVAMAAVRYNNRALSLGSLILAGVAPLFTEATTPDYVGLCWYLLVVVIGAIWIVVFTGQRELTTAALVLIALYGFPHMFMSTAADKGALLLFAYVFAALFFFTNTIGILKSRQRQISADLVTAAGNGLLLLAWIVAAAPKELQSLIISAWMIVFAVGAFLIYRLTARKEPFYVYAGVSVAMLAAATSAELHGSTLTIAYTIECGLIPLITYLILRDIKVAERLGWLFVGPIILSFSSIFSRAWSTGVVHKDFFVLLVLAVTFLGLAAILARHSREANDTEPLYLNRALGIVGSAYLYILIWRSLLAGPGDDNTAIMLALAIYTVIGIAAYFAGIAQQSRWIQIYGGVMIGLVAARLLMVDVWKMALAGRIGTFFVIGTLLVATAFLTRNRNKSLPTSSGSV